jgi:hypothetical protein
LDRRRRRQWQWFLRFYFFGDRGDRITDLRNDPMQIVARNAKPPFQDSDLAGVSHVNLIASGQVFEATHVGSSVMTNQIAHGCFVPNQLWARRLRKLADGATRSRR